MKLTYRQITSADEWTAILHEIPHPHPLQSWAWGELKSHWGWSMLPIVWEESGTPYAAAMILKRKLPKIPFYLLYAPKGPMFDHTNPDIFAQVQADLRTIAKQHRAITVKIDPDVVVGTGVDDGYAVAETGQQLRTQLGELGWIYSQEQVQFRNSVFYDLSISEEELLAGMKSKTRYNIRLATKKGVTVREATAEDFEEVASLYAETSDRNGFAIRPKAYYLDVWKTFHEAGMLKIFLAEFEGQLLSAVVIIYNHHTALYMYGASNQIERNRMPTYLVQWEAIRWAKSVGCLLYDFWGAPDNFTEDDRLWGVWRFKKGFQGEVRHHIGAWDYPVYPTAYKLYAEALPRYIDWLRKKKQ